MRTVKLYILNLFWGLITLSACSSSGIPGQSGTKILLSQAQGDQLWPCLQLHVLPVLQCGKQPKDEAERSVNEFEQCLYELDSTESLEQSSELRNFLVEVIQSPESAYAKYAGILSEPDIQTALRAAFPNESHLLAVLDYFLLKNSRPDLCRETGLRISFCSVLWILDNCEQVSKSRAVALSGDLTGGSSHHPRGGGGSGSGSGGPSSVCGDGIITAEVEQCDDGLSNGATACGCQNNCSYAAVETFCGGSEQGCDAFDTCDGLGSCVDRLAANNTVCEDMGLLGACSNGSCVTGTCSVDTCAVGDCSASPCEVGTCVSGTCEIPFCSPQAPFFTDDFSNLANWTLTGSATNSWHIGTITDFGGCHSPTYSNGVLYVSSGAGVTYDMGQSSVVEATLATPFDTTANSSVLLEFDYLEGGDGLNDNMTVSISTNSGGPWTDVRDPVKTPYHCSNGLGSWAHYRANISSLAGGQSSVLVRFTWTNNADGTGTALSTAIDDVAVREFSGTCPQLE